MVDVFAPVQDLSDFLVNNVFHFSGGLAEAVNFFIYDTIKILILLFIVSFLAGLAKSYLTPEKTRKILSGKHKGVGNVLAASIGIVTPFCSCSAVPLFIGFVEAGVPLGVTFSYLISAPMINEMAIILLLGFFGLKVTGMYIASGFIIAVVSGIIIGNLNLERYVVSFENIEQKKSCCSSGGKKTFIDRLIVGKKNAIKVFKGTWPYIILGVGIGAAIHGFVPTEVLLKYAGKGSFFAVPIAVMIGVPLYASCAGMLPVSVSLVNAGLPIGTVLAFTMATTALSVPEILILKRVMRPKLLAIFVAIVTVAITFTGYLFNFLIH